MTVPAITALPEIPAYSDANFETKAPAVLSALRNTFVAEMNAAIAAINSYDYGVAVNISKVVGLTAGYIPYGAGTSALASNANLNYDAANSRLNTPVLRASTGVLFGTDTAAANTLNDYDAANWTPVIIGTTSPGSATYAIRQGQYTKIGRQVTCHMMVQITNHDGTGNLRISGLPYPVANLTQHFTVNLAVASGLAYDAGATLCISPTVNTSTANINQADSASGYRAVPMDTAFTIYGTFTYFTD